MLENPSYKIKVQGVRRLVKVVAFGSSGSGKSSLIKCIVPSARHINAGSDGSTIGYDLGILQYGNCSIFYYGTPGLERYRNIVNVIANGMNIGLIVVDATLGMTEYEKSIMNELKARKVPYIVVANKIDLPGESIENIRNDVDKDHLIMPISAKMNAGVDMLVQSVNEMIDLYEPGASKI
jgi:small GTP-binding protein